MDRLNIGDTFDVFNPRVFGNSSPIKQVTITDLHLQIENESTNEFSVQVQFSVFLNNKECTISWGVKYFLSYVAMAKDWVEFTNGKATFEKGIPFNEHRSSIAKLGWEVAAMERYEKSKDIDEEDDDE